MNKLYANRQITERINFRVELLNSVKVSFIPFRQSVIEYIEYTLTVHCIAYA